MSQRNRIAIVGAGCHGRVLLDAVLSAGDCDVIGFLDDDPAKAGQRVLGVPVLGITADMAMLAGRHGFDSVLLAVGDNYVRHEKLLQAHAAGLTVSGVIHPAAHVSRFAELCESAVVLAGAVVNPGAVLEEDVCVNTAASVDHDVHLKAHSHVYPGATLAGGVRLGEFSYVGSGATVIPNISIGDYAYVGAGATVINDVPDGLIVARVPAREIGRQDKRPMAWGAPQPSFGIPFTDT